jgi:hypothetical protein
MRPSDEIRDLAETLAQSLGVAGPDGIQTVIETIRQDALDPVPPEVLRRAAALSVELTPPPSWLESFDRLAARIMRPLFDDGPSLAMGLRGDDLRQCTLGVDGLRLDLEIEVDLVRKDDRGRLIAKIRGQLDAEAGLGGPVDVLILDPESEQLLETTRTDDAGRFDLNLREGRYDLVFRLEAGEIVMGTIDVP